jgi:hypothetical protein
VKEMKMALSNGAADSGRAASARGENQDFLARAEELAARWRALALEMRRLLVEAWDNDVDVRPLKRALIAGRRGKPTAVRQTGDKAETNCQ